MKEEAFTKSSQDNSLTLSSLSLSLTHTHFHTHTHTHMAMVYNCLFSPNSTPGKSTTTTINKQIIHPIQFNNSNTKKAFVFSSSSSSSSSSSIIDADEYLEKDFNGQQHGISFEDIGDNCVVKMSLDDGSVASLMLPSGLITSYKAPMWHGGTLELLHTCVLSQPTNINNNNNNDDISDAFIRGGVSLAFTCQTDDDIEREHEVPNTWTLCSVKGDPQELIQIELVSNSNAVDAIQVKHIVTLRQGLLSSEIVISNLNFLPVSVMGYIISHLNVSTPEATYAVGLEGSDFYSRPPIYSNFSIIPPQESSSLKKDSNAKEFWGPLSDLFSMSGQRRQEEWVREEEAEGEERDNYKHLTERMSRIYTSAPRCFTLIDRGKRNSVQIERNGFNEMYMYSPGSTHKWYGKYAYICVGHSALLEPIILAPGEEWRGSQHLRNPNF